MVLKAERQKVHAVCIPFPVQGHVAPMLKLAKLIHHRGVHITFVNTEYNHQRLVQSGSHDPLCAVEGFQFQSIPDGLPFSITDRSLKHIPMLCNSIKENLWAPFRSLLMKLNEMPENPPVTCIIADGIMSFTLRAAEGLGIPVVFFRPHSGCGFWCYAHLKDLIEKGYTPLQDECQLTNGYLETKLGWVPGMLDLRLKDMPTFIRTLDPDDNAMPIYTMLIYTKDEAQVMFRGNALILNTFAALETDVLEAARCRIHHLFAIGPLTKQCQSITHTELSSIKASLWKEDDSCLAWLDKQKAESVVYVNFGSITVITPQQLVEFAWGLANSRHPFLWIIRPDLVEGQDSILPQGFRSETEERGLVTSWCPQEQVLAHSSVGVFLTHCGWNSTLEGICGGVPLLCWPFVAEQPTNCRYACTKWGIGMEIEGEVSRGEVERLVREVMEGDKGREMRDRARMWKKEAERAVQPGGSSYCDFERLLNDVLFSNGREGSG